MPGSIKHTASAMKNLKVSISLMHHASTVKNFSFTNVDNSLLSNWVDAAMTGALF